MVKQSIVAIFVSLFSIGYTLSLNRLNEMIYHETEHTDKFNGSIWALLVAGSNEYYNYRHQADICHAYHVLRSHGIPESNIIVMMSDDIANNEENPTKGVIINQPDGSDVYQGVPKDYTGDEVTPEMFLKVLEGNKDLEGSGRKVVKSTNRDHIFVFFADHGAPGLIAFPTSELTATQLNKALVRMSTANAYSRMAIYIEACESGSMFKGLLPSNINIFATTAANGEESSYACYWDDERGTYLGDLYSVNWMEDSDIHRSLKTETLAQQFRKVRTETNTSHVMEYGDLSIGNLPLSEFQGSKLKSENESDVRFNHIRKRRPIDDAIPSHDVPLVSLKKRAELTSDPIEKRELLREFDYMSEARRFLTHAMINLASSLSHHTVSTISHSQLISSRKSLTRHECYDQLRTTFDSHCFDLSTHPYALRFLYILVNVCESSDVQDIHSIEDTIVNHCNFHTLGHPFTRIH